MAWPTLGRSGRLPCAKAHRDEHKAHFGTFKRCPSLSRVRLRCSPARTCRTPRPARIPAPHAGSPRAAQAGLPFSGTASRRSHQTPAQPPRPAAPRPGSRGESANAYRIFVELGPPPPHKARRRRCQILLLVIPFASIPPLMT